MQLANTSSHANTDSLLVIPLSEATSPIKFGHTRISNMKHVIWCPVRGWKPEEWCLEWRNPKMIGPCYHCMYGARGHGKNLGQIGNYHHWTMLGSISAPLLPEGQMGVKSSVWSLAVT